MSTNDQSVSACVELNIEHSQSIFLARLQRLRDVIRFLEAAVSNVTEDQVATPQFMTFHLMQAPPLEHEEMRSRAIDWLQTSFLRDSVEIAGLFVDDCLVMCALMNLAGAGKGKMERTDYENVLTLKRRRYHKLGFPDKLDKLEKDFGIISPLADSVRSLNKLRTCLVHRLGIVTTLDTTNTRGLEVIWRTVKLVAHGEETGKETIVHGPTSFDEASTLKMHIVNHRRTFTVGEHVKLTADELFGTLWTFWFFGRSCLTALIAYAQKVGVPIHPTQPRTSMSSP